MDMKDMKFCQSCAMPMTDGAYGTEADGSKSQDYCSYCYSEGHFTGDMTMQEMIEFCVKPMVDYNEGMTEEKARAMMQETLPKLKRWAK